MTGGKTDDAVNKLLSVGFDSGDAEKMREKLIEAGMEVSPLESPVPNVRFFFVKESKTRYLIQVNDCPLRGVA